jgi:hypothetical protein
MFKPGKKHIQKTIFDLEYHYPNHVVEILHNSWAEHFLKHIFLNINEERFSVLYSDKMSRPNRPVNVLVGLLVLKELNNLTDDELIGSLYFDYRFQYALGITDFDKERICINTITNFRARLYKYEQDTGVDLLKQEVTDLSEKLAEFIGLDKSKARMDSMMISSSCKRLTRLELVYTVNEKAAKAINKINPALLSPELKAYLEDGNKNLVLYRTKSDQVGSKLDKLIGDAASLYKIGVTSPECKDTKEFMNLSRMLNEQCIETEFGDVLPIDGKDLAANILHNPSDPDATFRKKGNTQSIGYALNLVEVRDEKKDVGLILAHDYAQNTCSDIEFGKKFIEEHSLAKDIKTLCMDGAYYCQETAQQAITEGMELNFSQMTGKKVADDVIGANEFKIDPERNRITACPAGKKPIPVTSWYDAKKGVYHAKFSKNDCVNCPFKDQCLSSEQKKYYSVRITDKKLVADKTRSLIGTERHRELSNYRAGIEGVPSVIRRRYNADHIPVRGLVRSKLWINLKIMAFNFKEFVGYLLKNSPAASLSNNMTETLKLLQSILSAMLFEASILYRMRYEKSSVVGG